MIPKRFAFLFIGFSSAMMAQGLTAIALQAADAEKPKVTFEEVSAQVFKTRCNSCHNADKQKGGLNLETFTTALAGGGSGKVIEPGDSGGSSLLGVVTHAEEPKMPPNSAKIPDAEIELLKAWIDGGALENSGSVATMKAKPKFEFKLDPSSLGKPAGPAAMPENLSTEPVLVAAKPSAVIAMAASPWAPLVAIGGHKQVLLYQTGTSHLAGVLPFPEGSINVLKFSRNGSLLLAGGGRGGQSGLAVVFDVKTGKRVFEIGKEYDAVIAADISPDQGFVALGGPSKIVRVYSTADGELQFEMKKHTEWITAIEYSPDGVLLATGDRNNGLLIWEAQTGREFFDLRGHTGAITDVAWRLDSNVVASASEDTTIKLWELENGTMIKNWVAHGLGVASVRFAKDGRLLSTGRDRVTKLWDQNGAQQRAFEGFNDLALEAVFNFDDSLVVAADWTGEVRTFNVADGKRLANLVSNPAPLATRLETSKTTVTTTGAALEVAQKAFAPLQEAVNAANAKVDASTKTHLDTQTQANAAKAKADQTEAVLNAIIAEEKTAVEALKITNDALAAALTAKTSAEQAVPATVAAELASLGALNESKAAIDKAVAAKVEQDKALSSSVDVLKTAANVPDNEKQVAEVSKQVIQSGLLSAAIGQASTRQLEARIAWEKAVAQKAAAPGLLEQAVVALNAADALNKTKDAERLAVVAKKTAGMTALGEARTAQQAVETTVAARKTELDQALAAKAVTDKAFNDARPALDAALNVHNAAKAETEALASEKHKADAARSASASVAPKG